MLFSRLLYQPRTRLHSPLPRHPIIRNLEPPPHNINLCIIKSCRVFANGSPGRFYANLFCTRLHLESLGRYQSFRFGSCENSKRACTCLFKVKRKSALRGMRVLCCFTKIRVLINSNILNEQLLRVLLLLCLRGFD